MKYLACRTDNKKLFALYKDRKVTFLSSQKAQSHEVF